MTEFPFDCRSENKVLRSVAKCMECDWSADQEEADRDFRTLASLAAQHCRSEGHAVVRRYASETWYRPTEAPVFQPRGEDGRMLPVKEEAPKKKRQRVKRHIAFCEECDKELAPNGAGIVVFWAASSHRRKTGHNTRVTELQDPITLP